MFTKTYDYKTVRITPKKNEKTLNPIEVTENEFHGNNRTEIK